MQVSRKWHNWIWSSVSLAAGQLRRKHGTFHQFCFKLFDCVKYYVLHANTSANNPTKMPCLHPIFWHSVVKCSVPYIRPFRGSVDLYWIHLSSDHKITGISVLTKCPVNMDNSRIEFRCGSHLLGVWPFMRLWKFGIGLHVMKGAMRWGVYPPLWWLFLAIRESYAAKSKTHVSREIEDKYETMTLVFASWYSLNGILKSSVTVTFWCGSRHAIKWGWHLFYPVIISRVFRRVLVGTLENPFNCINLFLFRVYFGSYK